MEEEKSEEIANREEIEESNKSLPIVHMPSEQMQCRGLGI